MSTIEYQLPTSQEAIYVDRKDHVLLRSLVGSQADYLPKLPDPLAKLDQELRRAVVVESGTLPPDVIGLTSTVTLKDLGEGEILKYKLVMPHEADISEGKLSILAPLGTALLGYRKSSQIEWPVPGGIIKLKVLKVTQDRSSRSRVRVSG